MVHLMLWQSALDGKQIDIDLESENVSNVICLFMYMLLVCSLTP